MIALAFALLLAEAPRADDAMRKLELDAVAAKGKQEKTIDAIEAAAKVRACQRCRPCPVETMIAVSCEQPSSLAAPTLLTPEPSSLPARPRVPLWAWILGASVLGTATGAVVVAAIAGATR